MRKNFFCHIQQPSARKKHPGLQLQAGVRPIIATVLLVDNLSDSLFKENHVKIRLDLILDMG